MQKSVALTISPTLTVVYQPPTLLRRIPKEKTAPWELLYKTIVA